MHISVSDPGALATYEWTMSRYGHVPSSGGGTYNVWRVYSNGAVGYYGLIFAIPVRPVFFLKSTTEFLGGTGKSDDPFIIS